MSMSSAVSVEASAKPPKREPHHVEPAGGMIFLSLTETSLQTLKTKPGLSASGWIGVAVASILGLGSWVFIYWTWNLLSAG